MLPSNCHNNWPEDIHDFFIYYFSCTLLNKTCIHPGRYRTETWSHAEVYSPVLSGSMLFGGNTLYWSLLQSYSCSRMPMSIPSYDSFGAQIHPQCGRLSPCEAVQSVLRLKLCWCLQVGLTLYQQRTLHPFHAFIT